MQSKRLSIHQITLLSILVASCLAVQLLPRPPNVEFTSLITFVTGVVFGSFTGALLGASVMLVNGFLSPYGFAGPVMPFQMVGMSLIGLFGGGMKKFMDTHVVRSCVEAAVVGALLTFTYDLITNVGFALMLSLPITLVLVYGVTFSLVHIVSNAVIFGLMAVPLSRVLRGSLRR